MTDYFIMSNYMWIKSWTSDPLLLYYSDSDNKDVTIGLYDVNGNAIKDSSGNAIQLKQTLSKGVNSINLGDWLSNYKDQLEDGFYVLGITSNNNVLYTVIVIASSGIGLPIEQENIDKIQKVIVFDTYLGLYKELPPNTTVIPSSQRMYTFIYLHDTDKGLGRIVIAKAGTQIFDSGWVYKAVITTTYSFNSLNDMVNWMVNRMYSRNYNSDVLNAIGSILNNDPSSLVNILSIYAVNPIAMDIDILDYNIVVDQQNNKYQIYVKYLVRLGYGWKPVADFLAWVGTGAIAGAIAGSVLPGIGTVTGAVAGAIAGAIGFALDYILNHDDDTDVQTLVKDVQDTAEKGKQNITNLHNKAINDLNNFLNNGQITKQVYDVIKADIDALYNASIKAIDEVVQVSVTNIKKAFDEGYNKGLQDNKKYIYMAGALGFAGGVLISRG